MSAVGSNTQELAVMSNSFIVPKYITAPNTTIQNRSQVLDSSNMLQTIMGVERVPFRGINLLQKEFGVNGEQVWELESKDARVRFVGSGWNASSTTHGTYMTTVTLTDYIEVIFYGTGFNLLGGPIASTGDWKYILDGAAEVSIPFINTSVSNILNGRSYAQNAIINITSGLSLGFHSIKVRPANANLNLNLHGCEILNERTSTLIPAGQAFVGNKKEYLSASTTSAYNAGFSGTKGGRVSKYLLNGIVGQVVREVPSTPSYLTSADHTNEEVVRRINFREFGANRSDDFTTASGAGLTKAFTLDDGTTTLVGNNIIVSGPFDGISTATAAGSFFTITFVGTGLDIYSNDNGTGSIDVTTATVDGVSVGNFIATGVLGWRTVKVCSGLPYGTHTVKIAYASAGTLRTYFQEFIIYQPKKPTLPTGAIEIADYNVMANYVTGSAQGIISQGIIRKAAMREISYVGTWTTAAFDTNLATFIQTGTSTAGSYMEYSFFGTGIEHCSYWSTSTNNWTYSIDGNSNLTAYSPTIVTSATGISLVAATGILSGTASAQSYQTKVVINGLSLGWHKIRVTYNSGAIPLYSDAFDIITPIHIHHPSMKIGSMSLLDNSKIQAAALPISGPDLSKAKAWVLFDSTNSKILKSFNVIQVLKTATGQFIVYFAKPFKDINYGADVASTAGAMFQVGANGVKTSSACDIVVRNPAATVTDTTFNSVSFYGELLDE